jgi:hypothetical protein
MFTEDLSAFFIPADFAQAATLAGVDVLAIFDNGYAFGNAGLTGMASTQPTLTLATADVPATPVGATAIVNATTYVVVAHEPDGTGVSRLLLEAA